MLIETSGRTAHLYHKGKLLMKDKRSSNAEAIKRVGYWKRALAR